MAILRRAYNRWITIVIANNDELNQQLSRGISFPVILYNINNSVNAPGVLIHKSQYTTHYKRLHSLYGNVPNWGVNWSYLERYNVVITSP